MPPGATDLGPCCVWKSGLVLGIGRIAEQGEMAISLSTDQVESPAAADQKYGANAKRSCRELQGGGNRQDAR